MHPALTSYHLNNFLFQDWIYTQICETTTPLHLQLIPLIDVYINSIITPASKSSPEATNKPITEQEILKVFQSHTEENLRQNQRNKITTQLLLLYYLLSYEEALLANSKALGKSFCFIIFVHTLLS